MVKRPWYKGSKLFFVLIAGLSAALSAVAEELITRYINNRKGKGGGSHK